MFEIKSIIARLKDYITDHQNDIILVAGVMLISLLSFAMGYIFAKQQDKAPIRFEEERSASIFRVVHQPQRGWLTRVGQSKAARSSACGRTPSPLASRSVPENTLPRFSQISI